MTKDRSDAARAGIVRGLIVAGGLLGAAVAIRLLTPAHLGAASAHRVMGVLMGAVVVLYANAVPKALTPLVRMRCDPGVEQALRRFTGWSLTLGGVAYVAVWAIAPLAYANLLAASLLGTALLLVVLRVALTLAGRPRS